MDIFTKKKDMVNYSKENCRQKKIIGFVPTMGYLHDGHLSLMKKAKEECDIVIVSIYVNPTQFGPNEDLESYPRDFEKDKELCEKMGIDMIFFPDDKEIYPDGLKIDVTVSGLTDVLCGASRPGHFDGVTTVVYKLFEIIKPNKAYFGRKDYQQSLVIREMVKEQSLDVEIIDCPIVRESDGIAMSSRNKYLTLDERKQATVLNKSLLMAKNEFENGEANVMVIKKKLIDMITNMNLAQIDYVEIRDKENLKEIEHVKKDNTVIALAVKFGKARLIDNILI